MRNQNRMLGMLDGKQEVAKLRCYLQTPVYAFKLNSEKLI